MRIIYSFFCLLFFQLCFSQKTFIKIEDCYYNPQSTFIKSIAQDKFGFIWIAQNNGLVRFDGHNTSIFQPVSDFPEELKSNSIRCILPENEEKIWIGTETDGLMNFDVRNEKFMHTSLKISGKTVYDIIQGEANCKWILTENELVRVTKSEVVYYKFPASAIKQPLQNQYKSLAIANGVLWIIFRGGLYKLDPKNEVIHKVDNLKDTYTCIESLNQTKIALGSAQNGIFIFDITTNQINNYKSPAFQSNSSAVNHVLSIKHTGENHLWIGTTYGLHQLDVAPNFSATEKFRKLPDTDYLIEKHISTIFSDQNGCIWLGTLNDGLKKINVFRNYFSNYLPQANSSNTLCDTKVNAFIHDRDGVLWIGTRKGISFFDPENKKFLPDKLSMHDWTRLNEVSSFASDPNSNDIFIGTWNRINAFSKYSFANKKFTHYTYNDAESNIIGGISVLNKKVYIGSFEKGLLSVNDQTLTGTRLPMKIQAVKNKSIYLLFTDRNRNIWISFYNDGLGKYNPRNNRIQYFKTGKTVESISDNMIHSICEDLHNQIWVGTNNGINMLKPDNKEIKHYFPEKWSRNNKVKAIISDKYGKIWFTQDNRIGRFNPENEQFEFFNIERWFPNCVFQSASIYRDRSGILYFGTMNNGFITLNPQAIDRVSAPQVAITGLIINNVRVDTHKKINGKLILKEGIPFTDKIELNYNQNTISIEFASLNFNQANENQFAYKLEGLHDDWIYTNSQNMSAAFSNISPGKYTFHVKTANYRGIWSDKEKQLAIVILPPPWKTWWAYLAYILIILGISIAYIRFKSKKLQMRQALEFERFEKEQIRELNTKKIQFFTNISHEFRTPLTLILAYNQKLIENTGTDDKKFSWVSNIQQNAQQLLLLINQLLDFRKLEENQTKLCVTQSDIVSFNRSIFLLFSDLAKQKNINYHFKSDYESAQIWFDKQKIQHILFNLLSNAFKFTAEDETIEFETTIENYGTPLACLIIEVSDTGLGISQTDLSKIFDSFYQADPSFMSVNPGSGIGLSFVKRLIELHGGSITVESEKGKGSSFLIRVPASREAYRDADVCSKPIDTVPASTASIPLEESLVPELVSQNASVILVVEDNNELRHLICNVILNEYTTIEATNGEEGYQLAIDKNPDLIISDVLMPEMNGIEMCKRLKSDIQTSHIPIILLTAKVMEKDKMEGFLSGADDYIEKPFSTNLFVLKISNILRTREKYRQQFHVDTLASIPKNINSVLDQDFFKKANQIIELHMKNCDLDIMEFCKEMNANPKLVYRKIKAATGLSISEFIRSVRLKKAALLIQEKNLTIQEVCFAVGFSSPSYFTKCFKKQFGVLPKELGK